MVGIDAALDEHFIRGRPPPLYDDGGQRAERVLRVRKVTILKQFLLADVPRDVVELVDLIVGGLA